MTREPTHEGQLTLTEQHDSQLRRNVRIASLLKGAEHVLPSLRDAVVLWIGGNAMTIAGFETDELTGRCFAQSWYVEGAL